MKSSTNKGTKTIFVVEGKWGNRTDGFSAMRSRPERRQKNFPTTTFGTGPVTGSA